MKKELDKTKCYLFLIERIYPKRDYNKIEKDCYIYCPVGQLVYLVDRDLKEGEEALYLRKAYCFELDRFIEDSEIWEE